MGHGRRGEVAERVGVRVQYGCAAARQKGVEQAQLGGAVGRHVAVIVQVILRQVQERRRRQGHAVQPPLIHPVRGRLHADVRHARRRQLRHQLGDIGGVRRGQARRGPLFIRRAGARNADAQGAHAGRGMAGVGEDLPAEAGHRGLAVGACHSDHHGRLRAMEGGCSQGVGPARIGGRDGRRGQA